MVTVKKESRSLVSEIPGTSNHKFHGYAFVDNKRIGTVWKVNTYCSEHVYVCNEDFDGNRHSKENRPRQFKGRTLADLKKDIDSRF